MCLAKEKKDEESGMPVYIELFKVESEVEVT